MLTEPDQTKPLVIFDGRCSFCGIWIHYFKTAAAGAVEFAPYQEVAAAHPEIPIEDLKKAVHLIKPSGEVVRGAEAAYELIPLRWPQRWYQRSSIFRSLSEIAYRFVAAHRDLFYWLTVVLFGTKVEPLRYRAVEWIFLRLLAAIYLIAFASFGMQSAGLIGSQGILPASQYLERVFEAVGSAGFRFAPTLLWLNSSDAAIQCVWIAGVVCALLMMAGVFKRAVLVGAFLLYLSLVSASQEFLSYQWDFLLLETGFLAIFLGYSRSVIWLFRWLLFRLMFFSGAVKLLSGDTTWRDLTALTFHYQTQPLPTPLAWYAQQLPLWFQKLSCAGVFVVELVIPLLILAPRRVRLFALPWFVSLQLLIMLTGNYAFFNLLALSLCVFLLDDAMLRRILPNRAFAPSPSHRMVATAVVAVVAVLSGLLAVQTFSGNVTALGREALSATSPFGIVNSYGLFANMTTTRAEIVVEGSNDGTKWLAYEFNYKPGDLKRRPPWVEPYQPRLDWQMWFAALGSYRENVWFLNLLARLLQGRPEVLNIIEWNPFPDHPPRLVRAQLFEYRFTDSTTFDRTHDWWTRTPLGVYVPPVSLDSLSNLRILRDH